MSLMNQEASHEQVSSGEEKAATINDREVLIRMIKGGLREDQILLLQNVNSPERLLSTLEKLGRETPINLTDAKDSAAMRFKGTKVYLKGKEWSEQTAPVSPATLKGTIFWGLLEGALAGEGTICAGI